MAIINTDSCIQLCYDWLGIEKMRRHLVSTNVRIRAPRLSLAQLNSVSRLENLWHLYHFVATNFDVVFCNIHKRVLLFHEVICADTVPCWRQILNPDPHNRHWRR